MLHRRNLNLGHLTSNAWEFDQKSLDKLYDQEVQMSWNRALQVVSGLADVEEGETARLDACISELYNMCLVTRSSRSGITRSIKICVQKHQTLRQEYHALQQGIEAALTHATINQFQCGCGIRPGGRNTPVSLKDLCNVYTQVCW